MPPVHFCGGRHFLINRKEKDMTGKALYDSALALLACKNADGTDNPDCLDFSTRSVGLINILLAETLWLDRSLKKEATVEPGYITDLENDLLCHTLLATAALPYGLAALLVADEDEGLYNLMYTRFLKATHDLKETVSGTRHETDDCYSYRGQ